MPLCCGSLVNQQDILVRRPLGALRLAGNDLVCSGVDDLVRGTWRPLSFVEKLLSENWDQGDRGFDHGRDLIAEKRYS